ncbi:MAG: hypothetical protein WCE47_14010 [Gaiella sp.]|uniref:hypothetical protein n=1 Tax=Gaiella sp. TaxID=2663207 RepID=UPI003C7586E1
MIRKKHALVTALALLAALVAAGTAAADSTPVGPLPKPAVTKVTTAKGSLVAVALPRQAPRTGLVWRIARRLDTRVVRQVGEADVGPSVVLVFRVVGAGRTSLHFALTRGDASPKAVRAVRYDLRAT